MSSSPAGSAERLVVELHADGGIRVTPPSGRAGIATLEETSKWIRFASSAGQAIHITGDVAADRPAAVIARLPPEAGGAAIEATTPEPWNGSWTSMMWAADNGLDATVADLIERGSPTTAPRPWEMSPYRLAMRRGHVATMQALRAGGARDPVRVRPPDRPDAVVMRPYVGFIFWMLAPFPLVAGLIAAVVAGEPMFAVVGALVAAITVALGFWADFAAGRTLVAVDGPQLYTRRLWRWRGPVDLRTLVAIGLRETTHPRSPTLLRLANGDQHAPGEGETPTRPTVAGGFDEATLAHVRQRPGVRVLTVYMTRTYLRPGLERYIAQFVDPSRTMLSTSAAARFTELGVGPTTAER